MGEIKNREDVISFMQEMTARFSKDHVSDLMKNRRVDECKELADEYIQDDRFTAVAEYLINEGSIEATVEDFKTDEPLMNIMMFFFCFEDYYGDDLFTELYIFSEEAYTEYVKSLATSNIKVAVETADLIGVEDPDDYVYDESNWHITELTMEELIDCADPSERCGEEEDEEESSYEEESAETEE